MPKPMQALQVGAASIASLARCPHADKCSAYCGAHAQLREIVHTWEGVHRILATLAVDPGRQGQKLIKVTHGWGWECQLEKCGHDTPEENGHVPTRCAKCGYWQLKRVQISMPYLAEHTSGGSISDPYMASNFKMMLYRDWLKPCFGATGLEVVHLHCYGGHGLRGTARIIGISHSTVIDTVERVGRRYDAP